MLGRRLIDYGLAATMIVVALWIMAQRVSSENVRYTAVERGIVGVTSRMQTLASAPVKAVSGLWHNYVWLVDVQKNNDTLTRENRQLQGANSALRNQVAESQKLYEMAAIRPPLALETVGARVVAASYVPQFRAIKVRIDRGERHVAEGMPVVTSKMALVGRVRVVAGDYADVELASDNKFSADVVVERTQKRGLLTGVANSETYVCQIDYLEKDSPVQVGDVIRTSGLSGSFPPGLAVGVVTRISTQDASRFQEVEVTPYAPLGSLDYVLVLAGPKFPQNIQSAKASPADALRAF